MIEALGRAGFREAALPMRSSLFGSWISMPIVDAIGLKNG